jgi:hypothetical protein
MPKPKTTIQQLVHSKYELAAVCDEILKEIDRAGTEQHILEGKSTLPSEQDALHWYRREILKQTGTEDEWKAKQRVAELEKQFAALTAALTAVPDKDFQKKLADIINANSGGE